jgi:23S rRNA (uracil1939-C5)-methyltransferase
MKETRQIPVQKGKTYDISIVRLGSSGEGVGRHEGFYGLRALRPAQ